jgi:formylglycine-generating enzyme required for sulfatase activity
MQSATCPIRRRRAAGDLLGRLGWLPEPGEGDFLLAPTGIEPTGLDTFRAVPSQRCLLGKYPVTNAQFARFIKAGGYDDPTVWSETGWGWQTGDYDSQAESSLKDWLEQRPPALRHQPYWWADRKWNIPLYPVVGVSWFEAEAYARWLSRNQGQLLRWRDQQLTPISIPEANQNAKIEIRLPQEVEWAAAMGEREYPWGDDFDPTCLNCAESWRGGTSSESDSLQAQGLTAVTTFPTGLSRAGVWDGAGNVWEWMGNPYAPGGTEMALRGGSWYSNPRNARVAARPSIQPDYFYYVNGLRVVVAPILSPNGGS